MAFLIFSNALSFLFFTNLLLSLQILHARESQFFSKVTHANNNNNNNVKESTELLPSNKEKHVNQPDQQDPAFIPETSDNISYGFYGHDSSKEATSNKKYYTTTHNNDFNKDAYGYSYGEKQNDEFMSNTKYTEEEDEGMYKFMSNENNGKSGSNRYYYKYNDEGGKYYYNPDFDGGDLNRGVKSQGWENFRGYFGGNKNPQSYFENNNDVFVEP